MKTIAKTGKLSLTKETLRSLSNHELEAVNGASADAQTFCPVPSILCPNTITSVITAPRNSIGTMPMCTGTSDRLSPIFPND